MKEETFKNALIDYLYYLHCLDASIVHGIEYVRVHKNWIEWDFNRKIKRMTPEQWEVAANDFIKQVERYNNGLQADTTRGTAHKEEQPEDTKES